METRHLLTKQSSNAKLGFGVAAHTSSSNTCPDSCPLKGKECYARYSYTGIHWRKLDKGKTGHNWNEFVDEVKTLPDGWKLRMNVAGDIIPKGENNLTIDSKELEKLTEVVKDKKLQAWGYTHKPLTIPNIKAIRSAIDKGLVINVSTESYKAADKAKALGLPVVTVVAQGTPNGTITPAGNKIIICPNQTKGVTCAECMLCNKPNRSVIVGFRSHGIMKKKLSALIEANNA